jgi:crotonobetainyl-CoA:carnitine CoA-transferase CaiB-like acyl-CoA transferase
MQKWGLGYEDLKKLRPDIIYVSMAGFGHTGRNHHYTTMGPSAQALSGQTFLSGLPDKPPAGWGWSYLDDTGGMYGVMGALTALRHRLATGQGQHVDLSQMTMGITLTGAAFLDRTVNGRPARRQGYPPGNRTVWPGAPLVNNYRGPTVAPHNAYRTQGGGYNGWCVIVCCSDQEWQNLVGVMGSPAWATDPKFNTLQGRIEHQETLDRGIERWTQTLEKYALMEKCQAAGVRAMALQHPLLGQYKIQGIPFKLSKSPAEISRPAPLIGQHTREVLTELLGLSLQDIRDGYTDGTFWPTRLPLYPYIEEALT